MINRSKRNLVLVLCIMTLVLFTSSIISVVNALPNPAAIYCEKLGFRYEIEKTGQGEKGVCIIDGRMEPKPDSPFKLADETVGISEKRSETRTIIKYDEWDFFKGKVGKEHSYCAKLGYDTETRAERKGSYDEEYAVCIPKSSGLRTTEEEGTPMLQLMKERGEPLMIAEDNPPQEETTKNDTNANDKTTPTGETGLGSANLEKGNGIIPSSFDWRSKDGHTYIGTIRNQGGCGSCYAFAAAASAEGTYDWATGSYDGNCANFSESFIIWCLGRLTEYNDHFYGCSGADYEYMELEALTTRGITDESHFPYTQSDPGSCTHWSNPVTNFSDWGRIPSNDIEAMKAAIMNNGVIDVAVYAGTAFQAYSGGIYNDSNTSCPDGWNTASNHAVSLVGWGSENGQDYWILRNSWGTGWGESGYMRINQTAARVGCAPAFLNLTFPLITVQSPLNQSYNMTSMWANATLSEAGSCNRSLDGGANVSMSNTSGNFNSLMSVSGEGLHNVTFFCNDTTGNQNSTTVYFSIDTTPPAITVQSPLNYTYNMIGVWANVTLTETGNCSLSLDGAANVSMANSGGDHHNRRISITGLGQHYVTFYCTDTEGNPNSASATVYFSSSVMWPLSFTRAAFTINGTAISDRLGVSVSSGDINGDAFDDLIIGAYMADPNDQNDAGQAYVFFGTSAGLPAPKNWDSTLANLTINGTTAGDYFGYSISSGDVNGDGYDDIIIGAYSADPNLHADAGQAYVFFGNTTSELDGKSWKSNAANITINGLASGDNLGVSVSSGNVNGDTFDDIIIGAEYAHPNGDSDAGQAYVFFGNVTSALSGKNWISVAANVTINGTIIDDYLGSSVSSGNVNGDGYDDIIIGAYGTNPNNMSNAGQAYVFFGNTTSSLANKSWNSAAANVTINGTVSDYYLGSSVSSGDINGDTFDDLILGVRYAHPNGKDDAGQAYVFFGGATATLAGKNWNSTAANVTINGTVAGDDLGASVSSGDINGDGYDDLIIGALWADPNSLSAAGQAYVFLGNTTSALAGKSWNSTAANVTIDGSVAGDYLGSSVSSGDINGDTFSDLIIGAYMADSNGKGDAGQAYVFYIVSEDVTPPSITVQSPLNRSYTNNQTWANVTLDEAGFCNRSLDNGANTSLTNSSGNHNSLMIVPDGFHNVTFYCTDIYNNANGSVVYFYVNTSDPTPPVITVQSPLNRTYNTTRIWMNVTLNEDGGCNVSLDGLRSMTLENSSGNHNLFLHTSTYWPHSATFYCNDAAGNLNTTTVYFNYEIAFQDSFETTQASLTVNGTEANGWFGHSVSSGDFNGDGYDDLIIGAPWADPDGSPDAGQAFVFFGDGLSFPTRTLDAAHANITINGTTGVGYLGWSVSSGDINGDGYDDLIIGTYRAEPNAIYNAGQVYVFFGNATSMLSGKNWDSNYANLTINGIAVEDFLGWSVSSGDFNGDSYDDLIIGAKGADPNGQSFGGQAYVFFGGATATLSGKNWNSTYANMTINGTTTIGGDYLGYSVSSGDFNGDSYDDLIIGADNAYIADVGRSGQVYVFFGGPTGDLDGKSWGSAYANITINGTLTAGSLGTSVSSGDINGDGYDDLIIGADTAGTGTVVVAGQAYVFFGGASATLSGKSWGSNYANITINGTATDDYLGRSVSSGDVNGDGYDDLIIGAYGADPNTQSYAGQAYVFLGGASATLSGKSWDSNYANITINGSDEDGYLGYSVSSGDFNGDGYDDLVLGAFYTNPNGKSHAGQAYLFYITMHDTIPPYIFVQSPLNKTYNTASIWANATLNENGTCYRSLDDGANVIMSYTSGSHSNLMNVTGEGLHNVTFHCTDTVNLSSTTTAYFSLDTTAPVITVRSPLNQSYNTTSIWANATLNEAASCNASLDGGANQSLTNATGNHNRLLNVSGEGIHGIVFSCMDLVGNANSTVSYFSIILPIPDYAAPEITVWSPVNATYNTTNVWANVTLNESGSCNMSLDGGANVSMRNTSGNQNKLMGVFLNGSHNVTFYCFDSAHNLNHTTAYFASNRSYSEILLVDDDGGADYETYYMTALDDIGREYDYFDVSMSGSPSADILSTYRAVVWETGTERQDTLTAADQAAIEDYLDIHHLALFISGQNIGYDLWYQGNGGLFYYDLLRAEYVADNSGSNTISGLPEDPVSDGWNLNLSGGDGANNSDSPDVIIRTTIFTTLLANYTGSSNVSALRYNDDLVYFAFPFEAINNRTQRTDVMDDIMSWMAPPIDSMPPAITVQSPLNITYNTSSIWFNVTLNEMGYCNISLDGRSNTSMSNITVNFNNFTTGISDGLHNVTFYCNDTSGNKNSTGLYFRVDTTLPFVRLFSPTNTVYTATNVSLNYYVSDTGIGVNATWYQYNGTNTTVNANTTFTALNNQASTLILWVNDSVGNTNSTSATFATDTMLPVITIQSPFNQSYNTTGVWMNATLSEEGRCNVSIDGLEDITLTNSSGNNNLFVYTDAYWLHSAAFHCNDTAGNQNATTIYFHYGITFPASFNATQTSVTVNGSWYTNDLGYSVAYGDVNGDGYDDMILGARTASPNGQENAGQFYVFFGNSTHGIPQESWTSAYANLTINGTYASTGGASSSVASGDINGDGFDDVIIGIATASPNNVTHSGQAYVFFGNSTEALAGKNWNSTYANITVNGTKASGFLGAYMAAGDLNGDGYDDLILNAVGEDTFTGRDYVFFGNATSLLSGKSWNSTSANLTISGIEEYDRLGVPASGDFNGDGYDDLIIGSPGADSYTGRAYVFFGNRTSRLSGKNWTAAYANTTIKGAMDGDSLGSSVSLGDINGDGYDDMIVGSPDASPNGKLYAGRAYVFFGGATAKLAGKSWYSAYANVTINGTTAGDGLGNSLASGDINGDGYDELIISAASAAPSKQSGAGQVYIFLGNQTSKIAGKNWNSTSANITLNGTHGDDGFGISVAAGDFNGDSYDDLLVGAYLAAPNYFSYAGQAFVFYLMYDTRHPAIFIQSPLNQSYGTSSVWANVTLSEEGVCTLSLDEGTGIAMSNTTGNHNSLMNVTGEGLHNVTFNCINSLNLSSSKTAYFLIDVTAPVITVLSPLNKTYNTESVWANVTLNELGDCNRSLDSGANVSMSNTSGTHNSLMSGLGDGLHYLTFYCTDTAGNRNNTVRYFSVDTVIPAITVQSPLNQTYNTTRLWANVTLSENGSCTASLDNRANFTLSNSSGNFNSLMNIANPYGSHSVQFFCMDAAGNLNSTTIYFTEGVQSPMLYSASSANLTVNGTVAYDYLGHSVAYGDVNGDGYDDLIVGAFGAADYAGRAYVFFGKATATLDCKNWDASSANVTITGTNAGDYLGISVSSGDVNNDGYSDVIIGAYAAKPNEMWYAGQAYVFFGGPTDDLDGKSWSADSANVTIDGANANNMLGYPVASGDVNGDGYDDLIISAYYASPNGKYRAGQSYVFFGNSTSALDGASWNADSANITINGTASSNYLGYSVASGDVNNDGYSDLIIGAYVASANSQPLAGQAYVFFGNSTSALDGASWNADSANITINGTNTGDYLGWSVASGDVNGDSYSDLIVGAGGSSPNGLDGAGQAYVFFGNSTSALDGKNWNSTYANVTLNGTNAYDLLGSSVASGDVNRDGYSDLIIGACQANPTDLPPTGQAYVFFGNNTSALDGKNWNSTYANVIITGTNAWDDFGYSVASGDLNGDGYSDLIIGADAAYSNDQETAGQAYLFFIMTDTTPPTISLLSPTNTTYTTLAIPLQFWASENLSWVAYNLDNGTTNVTISGNTSIEPANGAHSIVLFGNDSAGNYNRTDAVYFTRDYSPPSDGGDGDGGGGGSVGSLPPSGTETMLFEQVTAGETAYFAPSDWTNITNVTLTLSENVTTVRISVQQLPENTTNATAVPDGAVYSYVQVSVTGVNASGIKNASFSFKMSKEWLSANGLDSGNVHVQRYDTETGAWTDVPIELVNEDVDYYYFKATLDHFSIFAIIAMVEAHTEILENKELLGMYICEDGKCGLSEGENCTNCPYDCGKCPDVCGDGVCSSNESCSTCPSDCGACAPVCGDGICSAEESSVNCPSDCGAPPAICGNAVCDPGEDSKSCPDDCVVSAGVVPGGIGGILWMIVAAVVLAATLGAGAVVVYVRKQKIEDAQEEHYEIGEPPKF